MTIVTTHGPCARCERETVQQVTRFGKWWKLACCECHTTIAIGCDAPCPTVRVEDGHVVAGAH